MGFGSNAIKISFAVNMSLGIFLITYFFPSMIQNIADFLLSEVITSSPQLRLYVFEAMLIGISFIAALAAINGVSHHAADVERVKHEG